MRKLFAEQNAWLDRRFAASMVPTPAPSATASPIEATVAVDNWGGLFDGGDVDDDADFLAPSATTFVAPVTTPSTTTLAMDFVAHTEQARRVAISHSAHLLVDTPTLLIPTLYCDVASPPPPVHDTATEVVSRESRITMDVSITAATTPSTTSTLLQASSTRDVTKETVTDAGVAAAATLTTSVATSDDTIYVPTKCSMECLGTHIGVLVCVYGAEAVPPSSLMSMLVGIPTSSIPMSRSMSMEHANLSARQVFEELSPHADAVCNNYSGFDMLSTVSMVGFTLCSRHILVRIVEFAGEFSLHGKPDITVCSISKAVAMVLCPPLVKIVQFQQQPWPPPCQFITEQSINSMVSGHLLATEPGDIWTKPPWPPPKSNGVWFQSSVSFVLTCTMRRSTVPFFCCASCREYWKLLLELLQNAVQVGELNGIHVGIVSVIVVGTKIVQVEFSSFMEVPLQQLRNQHLGCSLYPSLVKVDAITRMDSLLSEMQDGDGHAMPTPWLSFGFQTADVQLTTLLPLVITGTFQPESIPGHPAESTASLLSQSVVDRFFQLSLLPAKYRVTVAHGSLMNCSSIIPAASWSTQNCHFQHDLKVLYLSSHDLMLGMDWFAILSSRKVRGTEKCLPIPYEGSTVLLQDLHPFIDGNSDCLVVQLLSVDVHSSNVPIPENWPLEILSFLEQFQSIFSTPSETQELLEVVRGKLQLLWSSYELLQDPVELFVSSCLSHTICIVYLTIRTKCSLGTFTVQSWHGDNRTSRAYVQITVEDSALPWDPSGLDSERAATGVKCMFRPQALLSIANGFRLSRVLFRSLKFLHQASSYTGSHTAFLSSMLSLQIPWDPGGIDIVHRLEGKPNFKERGMLGTMDGPVTWAIGLEPSPDIGWEIYMPRASCEGNIKKTIIQPTDTRLLTMIW